MPLTADPSVTMGTTAGALASAPLAAATATSFFVDFSSNSLGGFVQIGSKGGSTVGTPNGCLVQAFSTCDGGTTYDNLPFGGVNFSIANAANTQYYQSFQLPTGKYKITLSNQDASYAITIQATTSTVA